jgi:hypothetical protein
MGNRPSERRSRREALLRRIDELAQQAIFGTLTETYRTCGNLGCHCHREGAKHGPHLAISYRSEGKTAGYHVPAAAQEQVRAGVDAWHALQDCLREMAEMNKDCILTEARKKAGR